MPRLRYLIPQAGDRVVLASGDGEGRAGEVVERDGVDLLIDLDALPDPQFDPGYMTRRLAWDVRPAMTEERKP